MDVSLSELRELVMDREAWRAAIQAVTKSRTWLSDWSDLIGYYNIWVQFVVLYCYTNLFQFLNILTFPPIIHILKIVLAKYSSSSALAWSSF